MSKLLFWKRNNKEAKVLRATVAGKFVDSSFKKVSKEIESLRKYDRGEKKINAPNLIHLVRDLQNSSR